MSSTPPNRGVNRQIRFTQNAPIIRMKTRMADYSLRASIAHDSRIDGFIKKRKKTIDPCQKSFASNLFEL